MSFSLRSDGHFAKLANELYEDNTFCDIIFITQNGSLYGHSQLIFQHLPSLADLMCEGCKTGHEKLVIFLPQVRPEVLEIALLEFYLKGDAEKLRDILCVTNVNTQSVKKETLADTDVINIPHDLNNTPNNTNICESIDNHEQNKSGGDSFEDIYMNKHPVEDEAIVKKY